MIAAAGVTFSSSAARSLKSERGARRRCAPASEIVATVREMGLAANSEVLRRGPYYVLHALDTRGIELRVVADAHFGDILSVLPAQLYSLAPDYVRAPRIIHVPQPDDATSRDYRTRSDGAASGAAKDAPPAPPQRAVQSAPPSDALLTPIRPTPNFGAKPAPADEAQPAHATRRRRRPATRRPRRRRKAGEDALSFRDVPKRRPGIRRLVLRYCVGSGFRVRPLSSRARQRGAPE